MYIAGRYPKIGFKTKFFNLLRQPLKIRMLESILIRKLRRQPITKFWGHLVPSNYLYKKNSRRETQRNGIKYSLDISDYTEHSIYFGYLEEEHNELFKLAKDKKIIIDVGVNVGSTLMNFAKICPDGRIFGFEPDVTNFSKADENLKLNNFSNVTLIRKALGERTSTAQIYKVNENNAGQNRLLNSVETDATDEFASNEVEVIRLDDFVEEINLDQIGLIKIDVEGFELKVLKGAENSLRRFSPVLFIELIDINLALQGDDARTVIWFLENLGYNVYQADTKTQLTGNEVKSDYSCDIICIKRSEPSLMTN